MIRKDALDDVNYLKFIEICFVALFVMYSLCTLEKNVYSAVWV